MGSVCLSPGKGWGWVWVAALPCQSSTFTKRNFIYEAPDSDLIVPEMPGMKGSIEALSPVQVPKSTPVTGWQRPVTRSSQGSRLSHVKGLRLRSAAAGFKSAEAQQWALEAVKLLLAPGTMMGHSAAAAPSVDVLLLLLFITFQKNQ